MELNLYNINEFNKEFKKLKDELENEDNKKILDYSNSRLEELKEELKEIQIHQIQDNGNLTVEEWSKKDFLEKEISKNEEKIAKIEAEKEDAKKEILTKRVEKENLNRKLNLEEAKIEIELADLQEKWNKAISEQNDNNEKIKQLRIANRELPEDSQEVQDNLNEILKLQNENKRLQTIMQENVITSNKGIELRKKQEEIRTMKNILENETVLEGIENPKKDDPKKENPKKDDPKKEDPKKEDPKKEDPKKEDPKKDDPKKEDPKKEDPKKENPKKENPKKEDPKKEDPKKEDPKKEDPKKEDPKKDDPKKDDPKKMIYSNSKKISKIFISAFDNTAMITYNRPDTETEIESLKYEENLLKENNLSERLFNALEKTDIQVSRRTIRKLDPTIINILKNNEKLLVDYVVAIHDHSELPFELVYDLKDIGESDMLYDKEKRRMNRIARFANKSENVTVEKDDIKTRLKNRVKTLFNREERRKLVAKNKELIAIAEKNEKYKKYVNEKYGKNINRTSTGYKQATKQIDDIVKISEVKVEMEQAAAKREKYYNYMQEKYGEDWKNKARTSTGYKQSTRQIDEIVKSGNQKFADKYRGENGELIKVNHKSARRKAETKTNEVPIQDRENYDDM